MAHFLDALAEREPLGAALQSSLQPTSEQEAIIEAAIGTQDNLLISALAGAAKTSTLVMVANSPEMQATSTLCLAFNRRIAEEMRARLPANCISMTLNSLGHKVWGQAIGRRLKVSPSKNYGILKDLINAEKRKDLQDKLWDSFGDLSRTLGHAKSSGWVPEAESRGKSLLTDDEFFDSLDEELLPYERAILTKAMTTSIEEAFKGNVDFDDQIFMSTCFPSRFPKYPLVMIDESQDLSPLNHAMLEKMLDGNRLMAVGDPNQAIYAFRGAYGDSMERLRARFAMRELVLSTSFRCPLAIIAEAQWRAPHMTAPDWAKPGSVRTLGKWTIEDLTQDAVIICRNNAPIFSLAIRLLAEGRYPQIVGNDIGKNLLKILSKLGAPGISQADALKALDDYATKRLSKTRDSAKGHVKDIIRCLDIFIRKADTLGGAIHYADHIMNMQGPVKLLTVHKAKGLEWPNVYILDRDLIRIEGGGSKNQEANLLYVAITRSKENLTYLTSDGFLSESADAA